MGTLCGSGSRKYGSDDSVDNDLDVEVYPRVLIGLADTEEDDDGGFDASTGGPVGVWFMNVCSGVHPLLSPPFNDHPST